MSTNYVRGRSAEYKVMRLLEAIGFNCIRAASSKGLYDVVGVRADEVCLVQSKLTSTGNFSEDENCRLLRELPVPPNVRKELWLYAAGEGLIEVRNLKEEKLSAVTPAGKVAREVARSRARSLKRLGSPIRLPK